MSEAQNPPADDSAGVHIIFRRSFRHPKTGQLVVAKTAFPMRIKPKAANDNVVVHEGVSAVAE